MNDCKLCGYLSKSNFGLSNHIRYKHIDSGDIESLEVYYIKYMMIDNDNACDNPICDNNTSFISLNEGYKRHCSIDCSRKNPKVKRLKYENTKKAIFKKYGVDNPSKMVGNTEKVKKTKLSKYGDGNYNNADKAKETNLKNHNGVFSSATDEYKIKYKNTVIEKYGVEHHTQSTVVKDKTKKTNIKRYGVEYALQNEDVKNRMLNTHIEKYGGVLNGSDLISNKIKNTNLDKYGTENPMQNETIKLKVSCTNLDRYGSTSPLQNKNILNRIYGVDNINELDWVVEKQKVNRKISLLDKYSVDNVSKLDWVQDIIKNNNFSKYGVTNTTKLDWVKDKMKKTNLERYGVENAMKNQLIFNRCMKSIKKKYYRMKEIDTPFGVVHYQSNSELSFIKYCISNNIEISDGDSIPYELNGNEKTYHIDFKVKIVDTYRLIEIKKPHIWYYKSLETGQLRAKMDYAHKYSLDMGYLPYLMILDDDYNCIYE